jgi:hypothetical protein
MKHTYKKYFSVTAVIVVLISAYFYYSTSSVTIERAKPKLSKEDKAKGIADMYKWQFNRLKNPITNDIPFNMRTKELEFAKKISKNAELNKNNVLTTDWFAEGPNNQGGRTKDVIEDITNSNILIAAAANGGIWRSENAGSSWESITDPSIMQNVNCITQDTRPGKTNIWYYGTGEFASNLWINGSQLARFHGNGIYKSNDGGKTWNSLASTISDSPAWLVSPFQFVWDVEIDKTVLNQDRVYAACFSGIFVSNNGGESWSTGIGGLSNNFNEMSFYTSVSVNENGVAFAALSSGANSGIYHSTNGINWTSIKPNFWPTQVNRIETAVSKSNPNILYVVANTPAVGNPGNPDESENGYLSLWKYNHSNGQWTNLSDKLPTYNSPAEGFTSQGGYDLIIEVKPDDENFVVIGGTNLYVTKDGFSTKLGRNNWIGGYGKANNWSPYSNHHPDQHGLFYSYSNPNKVYSAHDGGISRTNDITSSNVAWTSLNSGYITTQFWHVAIEQKSSGNNLIVGGTQDNGTWRDNSPNLSSWASIWSGDGCYAAVADNNVFYYVSWQNGGVFRYNDANQWTQVTPQGASDFLFITPYMLDPNNTNHMYLLAGDKVWKNSGLSSIPAFLQNPTSLNWTSFSGFVEGWAATALGMSKSAPNILFVGDSDGNLYKISNTADMNSNFVKIRGSNFPDGYISSIAVDPNNVNNILVGFSNYQVLSLFFTSNGGTTWTEVGGNLEENSNGSGNGPSIRSVKILPTSNGNVYLAGTSIGLYTTSFLNGRNTNWRQESPDKIGNVVVETMDVRAADGKVVVGTFGKGAYSATILTTDVNEDIQLPNSITLKQNYPNPFNPSTSIEYSIVSGEFVSLKVYDMIGKEITTLVNENKSAGNYKVNFDASSLASGVYIYKLTAGNFSESKKMILAK